jgi:hypothetical protein
MFLPEEVVHGDGIFNATPWTNGVVPYTFDAGVSTANQQSAIAAMCLWAAVANLTFVPRTTQPNYIRFTNSTVPGLNWSSLGMVGGQQDIAISNWSQTFVICHELAHALGFLHEHRRADRDTYITVNWGNIQSSYSSAFQTVNGGTRYGPYDFDSVMHYGQFAFSTNGQPTITVNPAWNAQWQGGIGQRGRFPGALLGGCGSTAHFRRPGDLDRDRSAEPCGRDSGRQQRLWTLPGDCRAAPGPARRNFPVRAVRLVRSLRGRERQRCVRGHDPVKAGRSGQA